MNQISTNNTNPHLRNDYFGYELEKYGKNSNVLIAVAFFTNSRFIKDLVDNGCDVKLIVRLAPATNAQELKQILHYKNKVNVRYYTSRRFHPKLYIFKNKIAFVGSSNLTEGGRFRNQEINVSIEPENPIFSELIDVFQVYWSESVPLTKDRLDKFTEITSSVKDIISRVEKEIIDKIGLVEGETITDLDRPKKPPEQEFIEEFLRDYQIFLRKFDELREIYESVGKRKENRIPLNIEIDQFLNWIRVTKAKGESYRDAPLRTGKTLREFVTMNVSEFLQSDFEYIHEIANYNYPTINKNFGSKKSIDALDEDTLKETVWIIHAFSSRHRFFVGGKDTLLDTFINDNGIERIKNTIKHLLFGDGEPAHRMADCIYNHEYRSRQFAESCIKETYGWVKSEETPICNERTIKSMQWLGFGEMH